MCTLFIFFVSGKAETTSPECCSPLLRHDLPQFSPTLYFYCNVRVCFCCKDVWKAERGIDTKRAPVHTTARYPTAVSRYHCVFLHTFILSLLRYQHNEYD